MYIIYITMHTFYLLYLHLLLLSFDIFLQCTMDNLEMHKKKKIQALWDVCFSLLTPSLQAILCDKISHNALSIISSTACEVENLKAATLTLSVTCVSCVYVCVYVGEKCTNNTIDNSG